jgi:hypothetical protein
LHIIEDTAHDSFVALRLAKSGFAKDINNFLEHFVSRRYGTVFSKIVDHS